MSYFAIENNGEYHDHVILKDGNGHIMFENYLDMDYETMKYSTDLEDFVCAVMEASEEMSGGDQTVITLVGEDDVFIWGIIIGNVDGDIRYSLVDWKKDGKNYRYDS
jgi:hypothetical protein